MGDGQPDVAVLFVPLPLADVPEYQHAADNVSIGVTNRSSAIIDGKPPAIPGDQDGMVGQSHDQAVPERPYGRVFDRLTCMFIDDAEHIRQPLTCGFLILPPNKRLGDGVEEIDSALGIGADHRIANACQRDLEPLTLFPNEPGVLLGDTASRCFLRETAGILLPSLPLGQIPCDLREPPVLSAIVP